MIYKKWLVIYKYTNTAETWGESPVCCVVNKSYRWICELYLCFLSVLTTISNDGKKL